MKNGSEFGRFVICIVAAFMVNVLFVQDMISGVRRSGYLPYGLNFNIVGFVVSLVIIYILSFVFSKPKP